MPGAIDDAFTDQAGAAGRVVSGRYRLQEPIGRGAMGIVWRGRDELLDREVAVKEVRTAGFGGGRGLGGGGLGGVGLGDAGLGGVGLGGGADRDYQRTLREGKAAARLNHPGVVTVFDVVEEGGRPWIVMELVPARSLDRAIAEDGPLRPLQAARVGEHLVSALACAHAAGVLHRDVKPGNVLLGPDDRTVLTDFGIASLAGDPGLTAAGMVFGTPGFTAPERIRGHDATPASDLWSVGATLYTAVEGRGPFDRPGGSAAITAGVVGEPAPRAPSAGPLGPVIEALLRTDPDQRPDAATAARLLAAAAAQAQSGWPRATGVAQDHAGPAFDDVREFPDLPFPAEHQPLPAGMPPSLGPPELLDLASAGNLPAFLDQPAFPGQPAFLDQPAFPGQPAFLDQPAFPGQPSFPAQPAAGGPARPTGSGPRRARVAALTAVAVVVAAVAGWFAYPRPGNVAGASGSTPAVHGGGNAAGGSGAAGSDGTTANGAGTAPAGYRWYQVSGLPAGPGHPAGPLPRLPAHRDQAGDAAG
jgi:eukaryotic-like serine/threonine-protein kinase